MVGFGLLVPYFFEHLQDIAHLFINTGEQFDLSQLCIGSFAAKRSRQFTWSNAGAVIGAGRLCINGGVVWGNYEDLSNRCIKKGDTYNTLKDTETSISYANRFKHAGFVSISYNLPFIKRTAEAKPNSSAPAPPTKDTGKDKEE
jgi:hypothetical protein